MLMYCGQCQVTLTFNCLLGTELILVLKAVTKFPLKPPDIFHAGPPLLLCGFPKHLEVRALELETNLCLSWGMWSDLPRAAPAPHHSLVWCSTPGCTQRGTCGLHYSPPAGRHGPALLQVTGLQGGEKLCFASAGGVTPGWPTHGGGTAKAIQCSAHFTQTTHREKSTKWLEIYPRPRLLEILSQMCCLMQPRHSKTSGLGPISRVRPTEQERYWEPMWGGKQEFTPNSWGRTFIIQVASLAFVPFFVVWAERSGQVPTKVIIQLFFAHSGMRWILLWADTSVKSFQLF